nr:hypothetical protein CFP56_22387 [Quercus suber]
MVYPPASSNRLPADAQYTAILPARCEPGEYACSSLAKLRLYSNVKSIRRRKMCSYGEVVVMTVDAVTARGVQLYKELTVTKLAKEDDALLYVWLRSSFDFPLTGPSIPRTGRSLGRLCTASATRAPVMHDLANRTWHAAAATPAWQPHQLPALSRRQVEEPCHIIPSGGTFGHEGTKRYSSNILFALLTSPEFLIKDDLALSLFHH